MWATKAVVSLLRNTTWRCGKVEKQIVLFLRKKKRVPLSELMRLFSSQSLKGKDGVVRAAKSLAKRHIVKIEIV